MKVGEGVIWDRTTLKIGTVKEQRKKQKTACTYFELTYSIAVDEVCKRKCLWYVFAWNSNTAENFIIRFVDALWQRFSKWGVHEA